MNLTICLQEYKYGLIFLTGLLFAYIFNFEDYQNILAE